jgi:hypothetical protein
VSNKLPTLIIMCGIVLSVPAKSQTPSITGIGNDGNYYVSVYGSNLSSGSGSVVYRTEVVSVVNPGQQPPSCYQGTGGCKPYVVTVSQEGFTAGSQGWYESPTQINYRDPYPPPTSTDTVQYWYNTGYESENFYIVVCNSYGHCSPETT